MKYAVTVITPPNYIHSAAFAEVAQTITYGLRRLGHDVVLTTDGSIPGRKLIVLGSNLLSAYPQPLADDAILYNLEQVEAGSSWFKPELLELFRRYTVWDYSQRNVEALRGMGVSVAHVLPIGYTPELTRIVRAEYPDIDVLFFGSPNPRREQVLRGLMSAGLMVQAPIGVYGRTRDALIARARVVLNVHYYEAGILELVRISYLLANRCTVLSEHGADALEDAALEGGVAFADYGDLVDRARELIRSSEECEQIAERGHALMAARPITEYLKALVPVGEYAA